MATYTILINDQKTEVNADPDCPLLWVLRDELNLTGTKYGCGIGLCGACTVHYNGNAVRSCTLKLRDALEGNITTIEGLSSASDHPIQEAWKEMDVPQCGYCQPGQIMTLASLLSKKSVPSEEAINAAMANNICRCGTYGRIQNAIQVALDKMAE